MNKLMPILYSVFFFTLLVVLSWILIHLLTVFGVFLAVAYPIWWMIAPRNTICFFCRSRKDGEMCPVCHKVVQKSEGYSPKTFTSAIANGVVLLSFSLLSIGVIFIESQLLFRLGFPSPAKTISIAIPSQQEHQVNEIFPMQVKIRGIKQAINAVSVDFSYDPRQVEVVDISTKDSFANIFIQKQIDNKKGTARFAGGLPNPGFSGSEGIFATIYLRGLKPGVATISFLPSSVVLANNGKGDNLLSSFGNASYLIVANISGNTNDNQKGMTLGSNVLGASSKATDGTQMIFYDEQQVLGSDTASNEVQPTLPSNNINVLDILGTLDKFIITGWTRLL